MRSRGALFVFEGADAAGKSSIAAAFAHALKNRAVSVMLLAFPGNIARTLGAAVYKIHHDPQQIGIDRLTDASLQALHVAAHLDAIETIIIPALEQGECIVLDRFWWSTWTYGVVGKVPEYILDALIEVERRAWGIWQPTHLFYIVRRTPLRPEPEAKWAELKAAYHKLISRESGKYPITVIENEASEAEALNQALRNTTF